MFMFSSTLGFACDFDFFDVLIQEKLAQEKDSAPTTTEAIILEKAPEDPGVEPDCLQALKEPSTQESDQFELDLGNKSSSEHHLSKDDFQTAIPIQCVEDEKSEDVQETIREQEK